MSPRMEGLVVQTYAYFPRRFGVKLRRPDVILLERASESR